MRSAPATAWQPRACPLANPDNNRQSGRETVDAQASKNVSGSRSAGPGEPCACCACREKFGPRPIFKIFSLDQIRVDQEKKEVRKRRASIYRTSPSDAVDYFLVSHVITGIVVIEFVISKNRRLGAISQRRSTVTCL